MLETPVAFFVFNRPDTTRRVFAEIAKAKPRKLLLIADGPRSDRPGEADLCAEVRSIIEQIDWDCEVYRNYADTNLGCKIRVSSGLDWVFDQYEEAIILEDDCLPSSSFFIFCSEMLDRYRTDTRIMTVSGTSYLNDKDIIKSSYYFSLYSLPWGWATWRRAWKYFDIKIAFWDELVRYQMLLDILRDSIEAKYWFDVFTLKLSNSNQNEIWDYIWILCCWSQNGLSVVPYRNLVRNIGFGALATNTIEDVPTITNNIAREIEFPLIHPSLVLRNHEADSYTFKMFNPWAITPPTMYYKLRKIFLPYTPAWARQVLGMIKKLFQHS